MSKPRAPFKTLTHEGGDALAKVTEHLKTMTSHLGEDAGDALSMTAIALGHAAVDLVGEVQTKLDELRDTAELKVRRHPAETAVATALVAAVAASLLTYALTRHRD